MGGPFLFRYECIIPLFIQSHPRYSEAEQQQNALSSLLPQIFITSYCLFSLKFHLLLQRKGAASPALIQPPFHQPTTLQIRRLQHSGQGLPLARLLTPSQTAAEEPATGRQRYIFCQDRKETAIYYFFLNYENSVSIKDCPDPKGAQFASPFSSSPCNYKATDAPVAFHLCIPGTHLLLHLLQSSTTFCASSIAPVIPTPMMQNRRTREGSSLSACPSSWRTPVA